MSVADYLSAPRDFTLRSRWSIDVPSTDLCTFIFGTPTAPLSRTPVYHAAESPTTHNLSLHSYRRLVQKLANGLRSAGLAPGQRVLVFSANNVFYPSLYLGIVAAGGIFTGANPGYTTRELAFQLKDSGAVFLFADRTILGTAVEAAEQVGLDRGRVFVFDDGLLLGDVPGGSGVDRWVSDAGDAGNSYGVRHWSEVVSASSDFSWAAFTTEEEAHTTAAINYSSGTTGVPKGVEITHRNLIANALQVIHLNHLSPEIRKLGSTQIGMLPMYHAYGQTYYVMIFPALGTKLYILPRFDFVRLLAYIQQYRVTSISGVPPIMVALAKHPQVENFDLSSIRALGSGAAPLGKDVAREVESRFHRRFGTSLRVRQGWGMTEATCSVMGHHPEDFVPDEGSVGELLANCEAKVVDPDNHAISFPASVPGELLIRAPNVCKGYFNNPAATAEVFTRDGWLKTGDIAYYSPQGKFYIVDRRKELIKVKGHQVAPAELEGVLLDHPRIVDAAVVGVATPDGEERPTAYVVKNAQLTEHEVVVWIEERCARHKWITGGVRFVESIPKNPSGKILRREVRSDWCCWG